MVMMIIMMMMVVLTMVMMMMMVAITMMAVGQVMTMIMVMFLHSSMRKGGSKNISYIMETFHELDINSEYICIYVSGLLSRHGPAVCYKHVHGQFFFRARTSKCPRRIARGKVYRLNSVPM